MSIIDYSKQIPDDIKRIYRNPNPATWKHPSRVLVLGPSGYGKTNAIAQFILNPDLKLDYDKIWIFAKYPEEELYQAIRRKLEEVEQLIEKETDEKVSLIHVSSDLNELPPLEQLPNNQQHLFIFDDMLHEKKNLALLKNYFIASRKFGVTVFFLAQRLTSVDRVIRTNITGAMLFDFPSPKEARIIASDFAGDLPPDAFINMYRDAVAKRYDFLTIDNQRDPAERFRQNMGDFIDPKKYVSSQPSTNQVTGSGSSATPKLSDELKRRARVAKKMIELGDIPYHKKR